MESPKTAVVALGGNAINRPGQEGTIASQFANTRSSLDGIMALVRAGYRLVITHGNGPQVGNALLRNELARGKTPILPLGVLVAGTEGWMGYMIAQSLQNRLRCDKIERQVVTIITQMLVDRYDPAFENPTKFIGQFYTSDEAKIYSETRGWQMVPDADRGWRRVVPSPLPQEAVESEMIGSLLENGTIVVAGGGGGIPVYLEEDGSLEGIDAVIDKDLASAVIGNAIDAEMLLILTSVDEVAINFGSSDQKELGRVTLSEIQKYQDEGQFPPGSMGPKIQAAINFLGNGGKMVTITSFEDAVKSLDGDAGTRIIPD